MSIYMFAGEPQHEADLQLRQAGPARYAAQGRWPFGVVSDQVPRTGA
jgi:hypothetical protein